MERLRNAARINPGAAVGSRGQDRRKSICRFHVEDDHRLAQDRLHPAIGKEARHQADEVCAGNARQEREVVALRCAGPRTIITCAPASAESWNRERPMQFIWDWFRWLNETTGINLTIFYDQFDRSRFASGFLMTVKLSLVCIVLSVVIGIVGAWIQGSRWRIARTIVHWYIQAFRNTPPLVQLYFFYFGLGSLLKGVGGGPLIANVTWAIVSLSFFAGAFNVEIFRSGVEAVPRTTIEAAESLGFSRLQAYLRIVLPLAFRIALPALNNNLVNLVKTTTLTYAIAVPEMLYVSSQIWSDELNVPVMMNVVLVCYCVLVGVLVYAMHRWERAIRVPGL